MKCWFNQRFGGPLSPDRGKSPKFIQVLLVLLISLSAFAKSGLDKDTTTWKGIKRYYAVYTPKKVAPNPAMVLFLHSTSENSAINPPYYGMQPWEALADQYGFLMVWPVSSYNPVDKLWYWECYENGTSPKDPA